MTPIPAIDARPQIDTTIASEDLSFDAWRDQVVSSIGNFRDLGNTPWSVVGATEIFPGCRLRDENLIIPEAMMPAGGAQRISKRTIYPNRAGRVDDPELAAKRDEVVRRAILVLWLPRMTQSGIRKSKPSTWATSSRILIRMAAWQNECAPSDDGTVFSRFTVQNVLTGLFPSIAKSQRVKDDIRAILDTLIYAGQQGFIVDWPSMFEAKPDGSEGENVEMLRRFAPEPVRKTKSEQRTYQPFSDEFVTEFMRRAIWIQNNLGPALLDCWQETREINAAAIAAGHRTNTPSTVAARLHTIRTFPWVDATGLPITRLPFRMFQYETQTNETVLTDYWPPKSSKALRRMVTTLQICNLSIVALCTGARSSELCAAVDTPLGFGDGRFRSITFKLIDEVSGQPRDWPLHPIAIRALSLQHKLAAKVRPADQTHLWVILGDDERIGLPHTGLTESLVNAVNHLDLGHLTGRAPGGMWR